jgi:aryl-alcohol dehydrogenase-like predicted oxidoreductase
MKYRTFPKTNLRVSEVGFGVWTLATGWWGEKTDEEGIAMLRQARELGINFFDTADTYGNGRGETLLQDAFGPNPEGVVYATSSATTSTRTPMRGAASRKSRTTSIRSSCATPASKACNGWA